MNSSGDQCIEFAKVAVRAEQGLPRMKVTCNHCGTLNAVSISGKRRACVECDRPVRTRLGWVLAGLVLALTAMVPPIWQPPRIVWTGRSDKVVPVRIVDAVTREPVLSAEVKLGNENYWTHSERSAATDEGVARPVGEFRSHGSRSRQRDTEWIVLTGWKLSVSADGYTLTDVLLSDRLGQAWNAKNALPLLTIELQKRESGDEN